MTPTAAQKEPKDQTLMLRLSKRQRAQLTLKAQALGLSLSAYLRREDETSPRRKAQGA